MTNETPMVAECDEFDRMARRAVAALLKVDAERLMPDASLTEDLKVDSLDFIALVVGLERRFDVSLPDEEVVQVRTVSELIDFLRAQAASRLRARL